MDTASMIPSIRSGSLIRATPPWARMSAGTRSSAITATAPASSAIFAWSAVTTSMITPPLSISAMPRLTFAVPIIGWFSVLTSVSPSVVLWGDLRPHTRQPSASGRGGRSSSQRHIHPRPTALRPEIGSPGAGRSGGLGDPLQRLRPGVVDLHGGRHDGVTVQPQHPDQRLPAHPLGLRDRLVVEPPGELHAVPGGRQGTEKLPPAGFGTHRLGLHGVREGLADPVEAEAVRAEPGGGELLGALAAAWYRVQLARRFHNEAVAQTQRVRRKALVRVLRLHGHAVMPTTVEIDDAWPESLQRIAQAA